MSSSWSHAMTRAFQQLPGPRTMMRSRVFSFMKSGLKTSMSRTCWRARAVAPGRLYIFVEGDDDKRLFDQVMKRKLELEFRPVHIIKYAEMANRKVNEFLAAAYESQSRVIFAADIDKSTNPAGCRSRCCSSYSQLHGGDVVCIVREIEGWYLAGLDEKLLRVCVGVPVSTDGVG